MTCGKEKEGERGRGLMHSCSDKQRRQEGKHRRPISLTKQKTESVRMLFPLCTFPLPSRLYFRCFPRSHFQVLSAGASRRETFPPSHAATSTTVLFCLLKKEWRRRSLRRPMPEFIGDGRNPLFLLYLTRSRNRWCHTPFPCSSQ